MVGILWSMGCLSSHNDDDVSDVSESEVAFFKLHLTWWLTTHDFSKLNVGQCSWSSITRDGMQGPGEEGKFLVMWSYLPFNARNVSRSVVHVSRLFLHSRCQRHVCLHSLWASSPGHSGSRAGKGRRACYYVSGIWITASKKSMRNADWWRWY